MFNNNLQRERFVMARFFSGVILCFLVGAIKSARRDICSGMIVFLGDSVPLPVNM